eukprot:snap_masked-scaffold_55-processed-gene-1.40-mRNA-1 protein AED:1.00 eAED:1.00 QI:0/0/0/0/1/1/2/0/86
MYDPNSVYHFILAAGDDVHNNLLTAFFVIYGDVLRNEKDDNYQTHCLKSLPTLRDLKKVKSQCVNMLLNTSSRIHLKLVLKIVSKQ